MSHTTTTVVTRQVTSSGGTTHVTTGNRDWNTGVLSCTQDCKNCCLVFCCPLCCASKISKRIGEHCCVPCFVPGAIITMRTKIRLMLGIRGSICNDCIVTSCCGLCVLCQMIRELDSAGWPK